MSQSLEIIVYLDSADYSNLSSAPSGSPLEVIKKRLLILSQRADVTFAYSGTHLSEMAPIVRNAVESAVKRTDLLSRICGRNALISFDKLVAGELECLRTSSVSRVDVVSRNGVWFPSIDGIIEPLRAARDNLPDQVKQQLITLPLNRKQRRGANAKLPKLLRTANPDVARSIIEQYPMRPGDANTLNRYLHGQATLIEAEAAFLGSFRDPKWLMRWAWNNYEQMEKFSAWQRKPAQKLMTSLRASMEKLQELYKQHPDDSAKFWKSFDWGAEYKKILLVVVRKLDPDISCKSGDASEVERFCPGIATMVHVLFAAVRDSAAISQPRSLRDSDFLDAVHALYAPYVKIYRTDGYMTPIIASYTVGYGTQVVKKLSEVPDAIERSLSEQPRST